MALLFELAPSIRRMSGSLKTRLDNLIQQRRDAIDVEDYVQASALTGKLRTILYLDLRNSEIDQLKATGVI